MRYMHVHGFIEEQVGGSESLERLVTKVQTLDAKGTLCSNYSRALGNVHYKINVKSPAMATPHDRTTPLLHMHANG
jgi:hypothetical protein